MKSRPYRDVARVAKDSQDRTLDYVGVARDYAASGDVVGQCDAVSTLQTALSAAESMLTFCTVVGDPSHGNATEMLAIVCGANGAEETIASAVTECEQLCG
jgi:hypothetical protein